MPSALPKGNAMKVIVQHSISLLVHSVIVGRDRFLLEERCKAICTSWVKKPFPDF